MKHTPTPWNHVWQTATDYSHDIVYAHEPEATVVATCGQQACDDGLTAANAEHIVRAVNAHAALVEALEAALPVLNHITRPMVQPEAEAEALQLGIAALALAKGDTP